MITVLSICVGIVVGCFFFRIFFAGMDDFWQSVGLVLESKIEPFGNDSGEKNFALLKLGALFVLAIGSGVMTHYTLLKHFG